MKTENVVSEPAVVPDSKELATRLRAARIRNWKAGFRKTLLERTGKTPEQLGLTELQMEGHALAGVDYIALVNELIGTDKAPSINHPKNSLATALSPSKLF